MTTLTESDLVFQQCKRQQRGLLQVRWFITDIGKFEHIANTNKFNQSFVIVIGRPKDKAVYVITSKYLNVKPKYKNVNQFRITRKHPWICAWQVHNTPLMAHQAHAAAECVRAFDLSLNTFSAKRFYWLADEWPLHASYKGPFMCKSYSWTLYKFWWWRWKSTCLNNVEEDVMSFNYLKDIVWCLNYSQSDIVTFVWGEMIVVSILTIILSTHHLVL